MKGHKVNRKEIKTREQLEQITKDVNILEAWELIRTKKLITSKIKSQLRNLGGVQVFRGYNSHSRDCFLEIDNNVISFGIANINNAGLGFQFNL